MPTAHGMAARRVGWVSAMVMAGVCLLAGPVVPAARGAEPAPCESAPSTPWSAVVGGVDAVCGGLSFSESDLTIPSIGFATSIARTYNGSATVPSGPFGPGWFWSYGVRTVASAGGMDVIHADGRRDAYMGTGPTYVAPAGVFDTLATRGGGGWTLTLHDQTVLVFDSYGRLVSETDPNGNALTIAYTGTVPSAITDTAGRTWTVTTAAGRITAVTDPAGRSVSYGYDGLGQLTSVIDAAGATRTYGYAGGALGVRTDANGHATDVTYDASGRVATVTDPAGDITRFAWDVANTTATITDPLGRNRRVTFDASARVTGISDTVGRYEQTTWTNVNLRSIVTDRRGGATLYTYDARGNVLSVTDALGATTATTWDSTNHPLTQTDALGHTTAYAYDGHGNLTSVTDPVGHATTLVYNAKGQRTSAMDANGHATTYAYDGHGNLLSTTDALSHATTSTWDAAGRELSTTDADGRTTSRTYDAVGRVLTATDGAGGVTTTTYDPVGNALTVTDPRGGVITSAYDSRDLLVTSTDALAHVTTFGYDAAGNRISATDALGHAITTAYDGEGRPTIVTDALGHATTTAYDANGNRWSSTDALGRVTTFAYDAVNRLVSVTDATGARARYAYDAVGNRTAVTGPNGTTTTTTYDVLNRPTSELDPLTHTASTTYDAVGNVLSRTDGNGVTTTLTYDAANRMVTAGYAEGTVTYAYNGTGDRTSATDSGGATTWTYDGARRITATTAAGATTQYRYDAAGNLTRLTNPDGTRVDYAYDAAGRQTSAADGSGETATFNYDNANRRTGEDLPNGVHGAWTFDAADRVTAIAWTGPSGSVATLGYTYDAVGNKTKVTDGGVASNFGYDALDRLVSAAYGSGRTVSYAYDHAGNRTSMTVDGTTTSYTYDAANHLLSVGADQASWDSAGSMVSLGARTYGYDSQGRLATATTSAGTVHYAYSGAGVRTSSAGPEGTVTYAYDLAGSLARVVSETGGAAGHVYGLDGAPLWDQSTDAGRLYYASDAMGSTIALTNSAGSVAGTRRYDAFGSPTGARVGTGSYWFDGEQYDETSGLIYLRARYYDPDTGRFLTMDPAAFDPTDTQSLNGYAFANNNPLRYADPSGKVITIVAGAVIGGFAGLGIEAWNQHNQGTLNWQKALGATTAGAFAGGCMGTGVGLVLYGACGFAGSAVGTTVESAADLVKGKAPPTYLEVLTKPFVDAAATVLTAGIGKGVNRALLPNVAKSVPRTLLGGLFTTQWASSQWLGKGIDILSKSPTDWVQSSILRLLNGSMRSRVQGSAVFASSGGARVPLSFSYSPTSAPAPTKYVARVCDGTSYSLSCVDLGPGDYSDLSSFGIGSRISSFYNDGLTVTLYTQPNFSGTATTYTAGVSSLSADVNNTTQSIRVRSDASAPLPDPGCTTSWANPVDGDWYDVTKWTYGVPTSIGSACITAPGTYTVSSSSSANVQGLIVGAASPTSGTITLDGSSWLNVNGAIVQQGNVAIRMGALYAAQMIVTGTLRLPVATYVGIAGGSGTLAVTGALDASAGSSSVAAALANSGTISVGAGATLALSGGLANAGTISVGAGGTLSTSGNAAANAGSVTIGSGATLFASSGWTQQSGAVAISGTFRVSGPFAYQAGAFSGAEPLCASCTLSIAPGASGSLAVRHDANYSYSPYTDSLGSDIPAGFSLTLDPYATGYTAYLQAPSGTTVAGTLHLPGSTSFSMHSGGLLNVTGTLDVGGGTTSFTGDLANTGTVSVASGATLAMQGQLANAATLAIAAGGAVTTATDPVVNTGSVTIGSTGTLNAGAGWTQLSGSLANGGLFSVSSNLTYQGGALSGAEPLCLNCTIAIQSGTAGSLALRHSGSSTLGSDVPAGFTLTVDPYAAGYTTSLGMPSATVVAGTLRLTAGTSMWVSSSGLLTVTGTLDVSGGSSTFSGDLANAGTVSVASGATFDVQGALVNAATLSVATGGMLTTQSDPVVNTGAVTVGTGATLFASYGWTQLSGSVSAAGTFAVAGPLTYQAGSLLGHEPLCRGCTVLVAPGASGALAVRHDPNAPYYGYATLGSDIPAGFTLTIDQYAAGYTVSLQAPSGTSIAGMLHLTGSTSMSVSSAGSLWVTGTLDFAGGTSTLSGQITVSGSLTIDAAATLSVSGPLLNSGTVSVAAGASLTTSGSVAVNTGAVTVGSSALLDAASGWTQTSGSVANSGNFRVEGALTYQAGSLTGAEPLCRGCTVMIAPGSLGSLSIRADAYNPYAETLGSNVPSGFTLTVDPYAVGYTPYLQVPSGTTIAGILRLSAGAQLSVGNGSGALAITGTLVAGGGDLVIYGDVSNSGTLSVAALATLDIQGLVQNSAVLSVAAGGSLTTSTDPVMNTGAVTVGTGSTLYAYAGWTQQSGSVANGGTFRVHGPLQYQAGSITGTEALCAGCSISVSPAATGSLAVRYDASTPYGGGSATLGADVPAGFTLTLDQYAAGYTSSLQVPSGTIVAGTLHLPAASSLSVVYAGSMTVAAGGTLDFGGGISTLSGDISVSGVLTLGAGAAVTMSGALANAGGLSLDTGAVLTASSAPVVNTGSVAVGSGALLDAAAGWTQQSGSVAGAGTFRVSGALTYQAGSFATEPLCRSCAVSIAPAASGALSVRADSSYYPYTVTLDSDLPTGFLLTVDPYAAGYSSPLLAPSGTVVGGTLRLPATTSLAIGNGAGSLFVSGTLDVTAGTLTFSGDLVNTGTVSIAAGATLALQGALTNAATLSLAAGATLTTSSEPAVNTGSVAVGAGATLYAQSGWTEQAGSVANAGTFRVRGPLLYQSGSLSGGELLCSGCAISLSPNATGALAVRYDGSSQYNGGAATLASDIPAGFALTLDPYAAGYTSSLQASSGTVVGGTLRLPAATYLSVTAVGPLTVAAGGALDFAGGTSTLYGNVSVSGSLSVGAAASLTVQGGLANAGTVSLSSTSSLSFDSFSQSAVGTLQLGIYTRTAFAHLTGSGAATLSGTLAAVSPLYTPPAGTSIAFLTSGSVAGAFKTVTGPALTGSLGYSVAYTSTTAALTVGTVPTATLTAPTSPTKAAALAYSLTLGTAVAAVPASAFSLSGTATGCVVTPTGSGPAWSITVDGCSAGTVVLSLKAGSLTSLDGAAGPLVAVTAGSITIDRTAPTTTLTGPATPTNAASLPYTVKFNESVTGLAAVDFAVTGTATGCVVGAPSGSGSTYTVAVAGCSAGTVVLALKPSTVSDLSGNAGPASSTPAGSVTIDRTAPTTTLTAPATPTNAASLPYAVKFNESVTGLAAVDFAVTGTATGCVVGAPSGSGSTYTVAVAGCSAGTVVLALKPSTVSDLSGNAGPASSTPAGSVTIDRTAPTAPGVPAVAVQTGLLSGTTVPITASWSPASDASGIATYEYAASTDGGMTWTTVSATLNKTSVPTTAAASGKYLARVRAADPAGNASAWTVSPALQVRLLAESAGAYTGTWTATSNAAYSGGASRISSTAGDSVTFAVTGRAAALVASGGPTNGSFTVYLDGATTGTTVSTYAAAASYQQIVWQVSWVTAGAHSIKVVVAGTAGHPAVALDAFVAVYSDVTVPGAPGAPSAGLRTGTPASATALPVTVSWAAAADNAGGSGVGSYQVQRSIDAGVTWGTATPATATSLATTVPTSGAALFRVRAVDRAGNAGAWTTAASTSPALVQTASAAGLVYAGTWTTAAGVSYSGGSTQYASTAAASATYSFTGRSVALVVTRAASRGQIRIYVDGAATYTTVDTYAASTAYQVQVWSQTWAASGAHSVKIVVVGTASRPRVDLDAISVLK